MGTIDDDDRWRGVLPLSDAEAKAYVPKPKGKNKLGPTQGGCWFCSTDECDAFDVEWDTYLHMECLREVLAAEPEHDEAVFMKYLLGK